MIYILGNGSFAQEVFEQLIVANTIVDFGGFIILKDDKTFVIGEDGAKEFTYPKEAQFIIGTSNQLWRLKFIDHFMAKYPYNIKTWPNMSAPSAYISSSADMGIGNIFMYNTVINAYAEVGNFNLFNIFSSINNNCEIGDDNIFHQYASAINGVTMGSHNLLSAGEVLFENIEDSKLFQSGVVFDNE